VGSVMKDSRITLADGRHLAVTEIGDLRGAPTFFFHGAPTSRLSLLPWEAGFAACGLRVISPDRPGYGGSSPQPGRKMSDWPKDVAELAEALGIERFVVAGHSSGGPYAVACAALLPARVSGAVVLAGVTDMAWPEAWAGYLETEISMMRAPDEASALARCVELYDEDGSGLLASSDRELPEPDAALLADEKMAEALAANIAEAFRQGAGGYAQDVFLQGRAWPFDPRVITVPTLVAHGAQDTIVPVAHSRHTAALVSGSGLRILPGHGHVTIAAELPGLCAEMIGSVG